MKTGITCLPGTIILRLHCPARGWRGGLIRMRIGPKFRAVVDEVVEAENLKAKAAPVPAPPAPPANLAKRKAKK